MSYKSPSEFQFLKNLILFSIAIIPLNHFAMEKMQKTQSTQPITSISNIKTSADVNLEDVMSGKRKIDAILWDFHGILGIVDLEARIKFATEKFPELGIPTLEQLKNQYPEIAEDPQKLILKGFTEFQQKLLDSNAALKADFYKIPKIALGDRLYSVVFRKYGHHKIADLADTLLSLYKPRPHMDQMITSLNELGVKQYLGSNITPPVLDLTKKHFEAEYGNTMLNMIQVGAIVDISDYGPVPKSNVPLNKLIKSRKPSPEFFKTYRNNTENPAMLTLFIDDKEQNVTEAIKHGQMITLLIDAKSPTFIKNLEDAFTTLKLVAKK